VDVARSTIVVDTEEQLSGVFTYLLDKCDVVRLKNRFARPSFNGYRDALFNLAVALPDRPPHIVEVQVHLSPILEKKAEAHEYYAFFRRHFHGNMASCDDCMRLLDECLDGVGGHTLFSVKMLEDVALSSDVAKLDALADLFEHRCSKCRSGVWKACLDERLVSSTCVERRPKRLVQR